jgi:hypothetical protein
MSATCDVAIVGAGPYGLATAAYLRSCDGLETRVFGEAMSFWKRHMPNGMLLRSPWVATHIADPEGALTLDDYESTIQTRLSRPLPLENFVSYGKWFQGAVAPDVDPRSVARIDALGSGFRLVLDDGEELDTARVVVAAGISPFAWRPPPFRALTEDLVSHASEITDLGRFAGRRVAVVGAGQSALESAALLHEAGAEVEVLVRADVIHWLGRSAWLHSLGPISRLMYAPTDVGPAGVSRVVAAPGWVKPLPRRLQDWLGTRSIRPAGAAWLVPRLQAVQLTIHRSVVSASAAGDGVALQLDDGSERRVDHVVLGTGYRVDIARYSFLGRELLDSVQQMAGFPRLGRGLESSVPGLHFVGAPAAWSFGPLMRFVAGTEYAARSVAREVAGRAAPLRGEGRRSSPAARGGRDSSGAPARTR